METYRDVYKNRKLNITKCNNDVTSSDNNTAIMRPATIQPERLQVFSHSAENTDEYRQPE